MSQITSEEEKRKFAEKVIRLKPQCSKELRINSDKISLDQFLNWLVDKVIEKETESNDKSHEDIIV